MVFFYSAGIEMVFLITPPNPATVYPEQIKQLVFLKGIARDITRKQIRTMSDKFLFHPAGNVCPQLPLVYRQ
jgi:hypothetical protein